MVICPVVVVHSAWYCLNFANEICPVRDKILVEKEVPSILRAVRYVMVFGIFIASLTGRWRMLRGPFLPISRPYGTKSKANKRNTTPKTPRRDKQQKNPI